MNSFIKVRISGKEGVNVETRFQYLWANCISNIMSKRKTQLQKCHVQRGTRGPKTRSPWNINQWNFEKAQCPKTKNKKPKKNLETSYRQGSLKENVYSRDF